MSKQRKQYSASFKSRVAMEAIRGDDTMASLSSKYGLSQSIIQRWKKQAIDGMSDTFSGKHEKRDQNHADTIKKLQAKVGELTMERDFLAEASEKYHHGGGKIW